MGADLKVHGVMRLGHAIEDLGLWTASTTSPPAPAPPFAKLWLQVIDHRRIVLYGSDSQDTPTSFKEIGSLINGVLRLQNTRGTLDAMSAEVRAIVNEGRSSDIDALMRGVLAHARSGHGGGLIVGQQPPLARRQELARPLSVGSDSLDWLTLLRRMAW